MTDKPIRPKKSIIRLNKFLAHCGLGSRRKCEEYIDQGLITVNGQPITKQGVSISPGQDSVKYRGRLLAVPSGAHTYLLLNKPTGVVTTLADEKDRRTVRELIGNRIKARVYPIGRLDINSTGLLLLTDDGDLASHLLHPSSELPRTYRVKVKGIPDDNDIAHLKRGILYKGAKSGEAKARLVSKLKSNSVMEVTLHEGKKREVRRMMGQIGHTVLDLKRIRFGPLSLGSLASGRWRHLTASEVTALKQSVSKPRSKSSAKPSQKS
jgi:23S rRNA pseudouridine2605 synthase